MMELDLVFARESANALEPIWELVDQVISGPDGLGCFRDCSRLGCGCCGGAMACFRLSYVGCDTEVIYVYVTELVTEPILLYFFFYYVLM